MARYMLEAPDDLMAQAKTAAAREGVSFAEWLRQAALSRLGAKVSAPHGAGQNVTPFAPAEKTLCELRNPMAPSEKCGLALGHAGDHVFA